MGDFTIKVDGSGPHHNGSPTDGDALMSKFVAALKAMGFQVFTAMFSHAGGAQHDVIAAPTHTDATASIDAAASGTSTAPTAGAGAPAAG